MLTRRGPRCTSTTSSGGEGGGARAAMAAAARVARVRAAAGASCRTLDEGSGDEGGRRRRGRRCRWRRWRRRRQWRRWRGWRRGRRGRPQACSLLGAWLEPHPSGLSVRSGGLSLRAPARCAHGPSFDLGLGRLGCLGLPQLNSSIDVLQVSLVLLQSRQHLVIRVDDVRPWS